MKNVAMAVFLGLLVFGNGMYWGYELGRKPARPSASEEWLPIYRLGDFVEFRLREGEKYVDGSPIYDFRMR